MPETLGAWISQVTGALFQILPASLLTMIAGVGIVFGLAVTVGKRFLKLGK